MLRLVGLLVLPLAAPDADPVVSGTLPADTVTIQEWLVPWEGTRPRDPYVGPDGKIAELNTGKQLCEAVPWAKFRYQPTLRNGRPVRVDTEVEVRFEPRKT